MTEPQPTNDACPKCGTTSGDDWSQCIGSCPMPASPHFKQPTNDAPVLVEQCDREAFAAVYQNNAPNYAEGIRLGLSDDAPLLEAFARHRLAALRSRPASDGEPVAYAYQFTYEDGRVQRPVFLTEKADWADTHPRWAETPLYAHPPAKPASDGEVELLEDLANFVGSLERTKRGEALYERIRHHLAALHKDEPA